MATPELDEVTPVAQARATFSQILRSFREDAAAQPVLIGSHRKPEAVLVPVAQFRSLTSASGTPSVPVLDLLRQRRALIYKIAKLNKIADVAVFGSVASGTERDGSDIDLLVVPEPDASLFDLAQFEIDMAELTGREVQVVSRRGLDAKRDARILAEAVAL